MPNHYTTPSGYAIREDPLNYAKNLFFKGGYQLRMINPFIEPSDFPFKKMPLPYVKIKGGKEQQVSLRDAMKTLKMIKGW